MRNPPKINNGAGGCLKLSVSRPHIRKGDIMKYEPNLGDYDGMMVEKEEPLDFGFDAEFRDVELFSQCPFCKCDMQWEKISILDFISFCECGLVFEAHSPANYNIKITSRKA